MKNKFSVIFWKWLFVQFVFFHSFFVFSRACIFWPIICTALKLCSFSYVISTYISCKFQNFVTVSSVINSLTYLNLELEKYGRWWLSLWWWIMIEERFPFRKGFWRDNRNSNSIVTFRFCGLLVRNFQAKNPCQQAMIFSSVLCSFRSSLCFVQLERETTWNY
jgi:hypothetical protein